MILELLNNYHCFLGTTTVITHHDLQASDLDSESLQIVYTVMKDPSFGHLEFNNGQMSYTLSAFSATKTFQQSDIDKGEFKMRENNKAAFIFPVHLSLLFHSEFCCFTDEAC